MNYEIIDVLNDVQDDKHHGGLNILSNIAIISNNLNKSQVKELMKSDLYLSYCNDKCINDAINRIHKAKLNNEKVFIAGDYDADGICATTIMKDALDKFKVESGYYIPNRFNEGYGLNVERVKQAYGKGYSLIITVDNGVRAHEAINTAIMLGMDVIVSDHHNIDEVVPCDIVVHPNYMSDNFKSLCGAGVALEISRRLIGDYDFHTVLACIATIGDMMPLWRENRNIVKHGLKILNQHKYNIFDKLLDGINDIKASDIAFKLVPKLNALGRLQEYGNPNDIVRHYFLSDDVNQVVKMKDIIINVNKYRQQMSSKMFTIASRMINEEPFIIIKSEEFHEGIVGLVAGKVSSSINRPTIVFSENSGILKGSGRSINGFDLHDFLSDGFDELVTFGGHSQAVGLSIKTDDFDSFVNKVINKYNNTTIEETKDIAYLVNEEDIDIDNVKQLLYLEPFGQGFKYPNYALNNLTVLKSNLIKNKYPKYQFNNFEAISFKETLKTIESPKQVIGNFSINTFNHKEVVSMNIKNIE